MRKHVLVSLALLGTLAISAGCGTSPAVPNPETNPVPDAQSSDTTAPALTASTTTTTMTATDIGAKLTAAGLTFTIKDETSDIMALPSKDAATKATKHKIKGTAGNVDVTVIELSQPTKVEDVKGDISAQWDVVKKISATMNMEFVDVGSADLLVTLSYKTDDKTLAMKAKSAIAKK